MGFKLSAIHAFIAVDPKDPTGDEGIPAFEHDGMMFPLIAGDKVRLDILREAAKNIARQTGVKITLARFTVREDLEVIE